MLRFRRTTTALALLALGLAASSPAVAQTTEELGRRWQDERNRQNAIDEQHRRDIDRSFRQGEQFRQRQEQQRRLDEIQVERQQLLNDQLDRQQTMPGQAYAPYATVPPAYAYPPGYAAPPVYVGPPAVPGACQQYVQAYDPAGRSLGLVCVR